MHKIKKTFLMSLFAMSVSAPAFANYSVIDVAGIMDNSITVQILDSANNVIGANDNEAGKAKNRRTQIIITPKLDQFMELIGKAPAETKP